MKREKASEVQYCFFLNYAIVDLGEYAPMKKIKAVMPGLREKKRYLAYEIISEKPISDFSKIIGAIHSSVNDYLGRKGASQAGVIVLKERFDMKMQRGIIKVGHRHVDELIASLCFIQSMGEEKVIVKSLGVSGILKKAHEKYIAN